MLSPTTFKVTFSTMKTFIKKGIFWTFPDWCICPSTKVFIIFIKRVVSSSYSHFSASHFPDTIALFHAWTSLHKVFSIFCFHLTSVLLFLLYEFTSMANFEFSYFHIFVFGSLVDFNQCKVFQFHSLSNSMI